MVANFRDTDKTELIKNICFIPHRFPDITKIYPGHGEPSQLDKDSQQIALREVLPKDQGETQ